MVHLSGKKIFSVPLCQKTSVGSLLVGQKLDVRSVNLETACWKAKGQDQK